MSDDKDLKRRMMLVGPVGAGKSTLLNALKDMDDSAAKTQTVIYDACGLDTPGEYLENPRMYRYIIALSQEVEYVVLLQDATAKRRYYPPGFACSMHASTIGVITKCDLAEADIDGASRILREAGVTNPIVYTSSITRSGIEQLKNIVGIQL